MTTTSFADYAAQQDARNTIHLNVVKYAHMLCDALGQSAPKDYHYELTSTGRKYHKIHMFINNRLDSIHCFIDKKLVPFINQHRCVVLLKEKGLTSLLLSRGSGCLRM